MSFRVSPSGKLQKIVIILAIVFLFPGYSRAGNETKPRHFELLRQQLIKDGFDSEKIQTLYDRPEVNFEADSVTVLFTYSEAKVDYNQFSNDWSINQAKKYMEEHKAELEKTEKTYGVDKRIITAILLVESGLGRTVGTRSDRKSVV